MIWIVIALVALTQGMLLVAAVSFDARLRRLEARGWTVR